MTFKGATTRRSVVRHTMTGSLALACGLAIGAPVASAPAQYSFKPPSTPFRLTRTLSRELATGETIVVTRSWRVIFERDGDGFSLVGEQIFADVDAPPALSILAQLEERRVEHGLFPLKLDYRGLIENTQPHSALATASAEVHSALLEVRHKLDSAGLDSRSDAAASDFIERVQRGQAADFSKVPRDLFAPLSLASEEEVDLPLPEGRSGKVIVRRTARLANDGRIMRSARREMITRIGVHERVTNETWSLEPM